MPDIRNIKESLDSNEIIGLVIPDIYYDEILMNTACMLSKDYNKIFYISINKPYELLENKFKQNKADLRRFYFLDCITRTAKDAQSTENCRYVSSPRALDEIQRETFDVLEKNKIDLTLIDSPSYLSTYYEHMDVLKFMHGLMGKLIILKCKGIFPLQKEGAGPIRRSIEMFTDRIVNLSGD